jgi:flagellin
MGLRIQTNMPSVTIQRNLRQTSEPLNRAYERLASGNRINQAKDDSAGLAISDGMKSQIRALGQAERNAQDAISFVQVAEGGLNESSTILIRLRELAIQSASDTISDKERSYINIEVGQLVQEFDRIAKTTEFSGTKLLDGIGSTLDFQIGIHNGSDNRIQLDTSKTDATSSNLNLNGISVEDKDSALDSLEDLDEALHQVSTMRSQFGAAQSRMGSTINNLVVNKENLTAANSRIRDSDLAQEASEMAKWNIIQQSGIAALAQANNSTYSVLKLLS